MDGRVLEWRGGGEMLRKERGALIVLFQLRGSFILTGLIREKHAAKIAQTSIFTIFKNSLNFGLIQKSPRKKAQRRITLITPKINYAFFIALEN